MFKYGPWGHKESDTTEHFPHSKSILSRVHSPMKAAVAVSWVWVRGFTREMPKPLGKLAGSFQRQAPGGRGRPRAVASDTGPERRALTRLLPGPPSHCTLLLLTCPGPGSRLATLNFGFYGQRRKRRHREGRKRLPPSHAQTCSCFGLGGSQYFHRAGRAGAETQVLAPSALGRGWGAGGLLSRGPVSGCPDLEDMSVMILRTQGPDALFDDHKLVLHTSSADAERARVFHACGELMPLLPCPGGGGDGLGLGEQNGAQLGPLLAYGIGRNSRHCPVSVDPGLALLYATSLCLWRPTPPPWGQGTSRTFISLLAAVVHIASSFFLLLK